MIPDGARFQERVPGNVARFLDFLGRHQMRTTFFTVGDVARRYPDLVGDLVAEGHEVACHSSDHVTLDQHDPESFRDDLARNLSDLARAGVDEVRGFRAPMFSLNAETAWAYQHLADFGFTYSSSVLPARHPLYGWAGFDPEPQRMEAGMWEIPVTLLNVPGLRVPIVGGVYFRVLLFAVIHRRCRSRFREGKPVVGYLHPFDIDTEQEPLMHPRLNGNRFYNWLMYRNRATVFERLEKLMALGATIMPYAEFVDTHLNAYAPAPRFAL